MTAERLYTQAELDAAKREVLHEFGRVGYGLADIRDCTTCRKPYVDWSVSSSMTCHSCRTDLRLKRAEDRVSLLEANFDEDEVLKLCGEVAEAVKVWCADRNTMGPFRALKPEIDLFALVRDARARRTQVG